MKYLITGCYGFIGKSVVEKLENSELVLVSRRTSNNKKGAFNNSNVTELNVDISNLSDAKLMLFGVDSIIHLAALAHVKDNKSASLASKFDKVNVHGTLDLAKHAANMGVRRFIFVSSIGVNGNFSLSRFSEIDTPNPQGLYASSKYKAELGLMELARHSDMEVVIIRPPLVYGPEPLGNFSLLLRAVTKGYPMPLGSVIENKRSLIALENLADFIILCADYKKTPQAANQTFLISDGEDVSTAELFNRVAKAYGKKSRLFPFPQSFLRLGAKLLGKQDMADRLLGSLQVDSSKARELLNWKPVITMQEQLKKMAEADKLANQK